MAPALPQIFMLIAPPLYNDCMAASTHHLFALRHFIDTARISRRPLHACFVDLQKAYDTVQHHLLWDKLESNWGGPPHAGGHQVFVFQWHSLDEGGWHGWRAPDSANGCSSRLPS